MASGNAWPFFLFQLDQPEVGSESEPKKLYGLSQAIGILSSCVCRTVSSCWSSASLASSSVILELACTNFCLPFSDNLALQRPCSPPFWHHWSDCCGGDCATWLSYLTQRMPHPLYGEWCLDMQFGRPCQPPWVVFLPSAPLMLLLHAKRMLHVIVRIVLFLFNIKLRNFMCIE